MVMRKGFGRLSGALCVATAAMAAPASAQTIGISPVGLNLAADQRIATVQLTNRGTEDAAIQVRWFAWSQPDGADALTPTPDLLASPPLAKIAPGQTQTVRILLKAAPTNSEAAYRLLFDQIPTAPAAGGVRVALRISIPLFAQPRAAVHS